MATATPTLTTSAYVLHNLGLAAGFGGSLFGKVALNPSARLISDRSERAKVVNAAWNGYNIINLLSLGTTALTWAAGRFLLSGRELGPDARKLVVAKDVLIGTTLATGAINAVTGGYMGKKAAEGSLKMESGAEAAAGSEEKAAKATKAVNWLGIVNIACMAGVIAVSTWLDNKASTTSRWGAISRILP